MTQHRHFKRISFATEAQVIIAGQIYSCTLMDVALRGALCHSPAQSLPLPLGAACELRILLPSSDISLDFGAELVHCEKNEYGFRFTTQDTTTIAHLRRLLELNIGDSDQVEEEIRYWLKS
ncbi:MAG: PilZ domain-containing protein [Deltaproteobacteria bacterium]|nr:PilZ domain-containing protein [Deltaproteobacteria bacterium]NCP04213.1 PilZ domain-containing protein [Deltaproteobacteria bacterium]